MTSQFTVHIDTKRNGYCNRLVYHIVKSFSGKKCDEAPLLKTLVGKTLAIEIIFAKVFTTKNFTVQYVRIKRQSVNSSVKQCSKCIGS